MKKHYPWQRDYKEATDRFNVLKKFISEIVYFIHEEIMQNDAKLEDILIAADKVARRIAATNCDLQGGWKLHKTWFRCGFLQLTAYGTYVTDWNDPRGIMDNLKGVFKTLGWNYENALFPKSTSVMSTIKLDFLKSHDGDGAEEFGKFTALIVPTAKFPNGSIYESSSLKQWELCEDLENGSFLMVAETRDKFDNIKIREMKMTERDLNKMKRVL